MVLLIMVHSCGTKLNQKSKLKIYWSDLSGADAHDDYPNTPF